MYLNENKTRRARRAAEKQGLVLRKSKRRNPAALDYGQYWLIDARSHFTVYGGDYGVDLDDIKDWLSMPGQQE